MGNRHFLAKGWPEFSAFFFDQMLPEPHSTKQLEDILGWTGATTGQVMLARPGRRQVPRGRRRSTEALLRAIDQPVLVIRGTEDRCQPLGRAPEPRRAGPVASCWCWRAPATCRWPATRSRSTAPSRASSTGSPGRPRPASVAVGPARSVGRGRCTSRSPIGLGHVRRDLAIADAMRERRPDLEVQWLTQSPVAEFLEQRGEVVHPASRAAGQRVGALRVGVGRARPARVPGRARGWTRCWSTTSWCSTTWSSGSRSTCGWATRPGTSTTSCTRTPSSSGRRSSG